MTLTRTRLKLAAVFALAAFAVAGCAQSASDETLSAEAPAVDEALPAESDSPETDAPTDVTSLTLAAVAQNASPENCWVAIEGQVYDLTEWINQHPGGAGNITSLCGTDGTSRFSNQHGGSSSAESTLERYLLGPLVG
jgi:cytochrome b involved in lipid metabolism